MNILYINHYAGSLSLGMEFRPYYFAREWKKKGHNVLIVAASFSHLRKQNPIITNDYEIQTIEDVNYLWIKTGSYEGNGIKRALTLFEFCTKLQTGASKIIRTFHPDIVITSSTYPLDTYPAQRIAAKAGAKYIHEAHDLWPLTLIELAGWSEKHPFIQMLAAAEKSAYSKSDKVVGLFAGQREHMLSHGMQSKDKFTHIPNGVALEDWAEPEALAKGHATHIQKLKDQGKFIICYLGGHAISNALDTLLSAAELMRDDDRFAFLLVGSGTEKERLMKRAENEKLTNVFFLPPIGKKQVPSLLKECDALYIGAEPCTLYRFGVSMNKVYDYMMAAKPIIYGVQAANNDVEEAGCGITIEPNSAGDIKRAALRLFDMSPEQRAEMGEHGKKWVMENCAYSILAEKFLNVMHDA